MASSVHSNHASAASPPRPSVLDANVPIENTDQLRIAIDQGRSADSDEVAQAYRMKSPVDSETMSPTFPI
ncbi:hypothetical protein ACVIQY_005247 [Bradyrhizobium sp. USDA 3051]